jgi:hypothetical protein
MGKPIALKISFPVHDDLDAMVAWIGCPAAMRSGSALRSASIS